MNIKFTSPEKLKREKLEKRQNLIIKNIERICIRKERGIGITKSELKWLKKEIIPLLKETGWGYETTDYNDGSEYTYFKVKPLTSEEIQQLQNQKTEDEKLGRMFDV